MAGLIDRSWLARLTKRLTSGILREAGRGSAMALGCSQYIWVALNERAPNVTRRNGTTMMVSVVLSDTVVGVRCSQHMTFCWSGPQGCACPSFPPPPHPRKGLEAHATVAYIGRRSPGRDFFHHGQHFPPWPLPYFLPASSVQPALFLHLSRDPCSRVPYHRPISLCSLLSESPLG